MGRISLWNAALAYLGLVLVMSLWTFVVYDFDKRRAGRGGRRVPEQTLHWLALAGGWPGAFAGQRWFRHKTSKLSFLVVYWITVVLHCAAVGGIVYAFLAPPATGAAPSASPSHQIRIEPRGRAE